MNDLFFNKKKYQLLALTPLLFPLAILGGEAGSCTNEFLLCHSSGQDQVVCVDSNTYKKDSRYLSVSKKDFLDYLSSRTSLHHFRIVKQLGENDSFKKVASQKIREIIEQTMQSQKVKGGLFEGVDSEEAREILREALINHVKGTATSTIPKNAISKNP